MVKQALVAALLLLVIALPTLADQQLEIVTPEWAAAHANDPSVRVLDLRMDFHQYFIGHVPNAVSMADNTLRGPREGVPVQYLPIPLQAELLKRAGVTDNQTIVLYSDGDASVGASMVSYILERMGHPNVKIIDGGWTSYKASQKPDQQYPKYKPGTLTTHPAKTYATLSDVVQAQGKPGYKIIDARGSDAYQGNVSVWMRNGHIPSAINIPWPSLMDPNNLHKFKTAAEMQAIYDANGVKKTDTIIAYCGTSREASIEYAILKHILGYPNVLLYEGSWAEYSSHPELPMTTGPNP